MTEPERQPGELPQRLWGAEVGLTGRVRGTARGEGLLPRRRTSRTPGRDAATAAGLLQPHHPRNKSGDLGAVLHVGVAKVSDEQLLLLPILDDETGEYQREAKSDCTWPTSMAVAATATRRPV